MTVRKNGLLLVNLGTPEAPTPEAVGSYLNEFLMDPFVIDIPAPFRWFLVKHLIVPKRKQTSAEAYKTIWTSRGSPLLFHLRDLTQAVRKELGNEWVVESAMRYGLPSIRSGLERLKALGVTDLKVIPLYPQYAESSSRSSIEKVKTELLKIGWSPATEFVSSFHDEPLQITAWAELIGEKLSTLDPKTHVLFSYHGLPERHLKKADPTGSFCCKEGFGCCEKILSSQCVSHSVCYRAQSVETSHLIAERLGLSRDRWSISFQSRLGRTPWIKPFTDVVVPELAGHGVRSLLVVTPSFVADCLETIEEIGDRARATFFEAGGSEFHRVECLNSHPRWVQAVVEMARRV